MATSAVLGIIASSPSDRQVVLDAICETAAKLCGAADATIRLVEADSLVITSRYGSLQSPVERLPLTERGGMAARAILDRRVVHTADLWADDPAVTDGGRRNARLGNPRTLL